MLRNQFRDFPAALTNRPRQGYPSGFSHTLSILSSSGAFPGCRGRLGFLALLPTHLQGSLRASRVCRCLPGGFQGSGLTSLPHRPLSPVATGGSIRSRACWALEGQRVEEGEMGKGVNSVVTNGDWTFGGGHTIGYTDAAL